MSDIFEQVSAIVDNTPYQQALRRCDEVRRFIQHEQVDRKWQSAIDHAQLLSVSQHEVPNGTPLWHAVFFMNTMFVHMFLAEEDGKYVKLSPVAVLGVGHNVELA
jgi:hypothetical protein